jgi:hypothetical protein
MRITRTIPLNDVLGGNSAIDLTLDVTNLLNFTDAISFFPATGSPDFDGILLNRQQSEFPATTYYKSKDPYVKASYAPDQYDRAGFRRYNSRVDYNQDGRVTAEENFRGYTEYVNDAVARRGNYQFPRTAFFAVAFRF